MGHTLSVVSTPTNPIFFQELQMIRRRLLIVATVVASVVLAACSDMTGPTNDTCPVNNGSSTCK
jgi:predicted small secreted protein